MELQFFANDLLITLAGVAAILAAGVALQTELIGPMIGQRRAPSPPSGGHPRHAPPLPPAPREPAAREPSPERIARPLTVATAGAAAPAPVTTLTREATYPAPPVFGQRPSRAHALPWLLPKPVAQPGVAADEARLGDLTVRAASLLGPGHRCEEPAVARQDAYALGRDPTGRYLIVAVADGLSSSSRSDLGAATAAEAAVDLIAHALGRRPDPAALDESRILHDVCARMTDEAARRGLTAQDVCAVLIVAVVDTHSGRNGRDCWFTWIGDVSAWQLRGERWEPFAGDLKADDGGIASNAVSACLPLHPGRAERRIYRFPAGAVLALVSDGVGDAWTMMSEANAYFARQWSDPPALGAFLNDIGYDARGFQDDRTAVTVWTGR
ncbi:protein phosphatase 2C domain-containing protein [Actinoplanes solisilvae]|uniref:protein phosphatase 2C domain-containing protein n=1 Tax=Actinoplanes solisilvae TaxID=2486853 RepID=UPI0013E3DFA6|nr:protein phosphatase 2C domain-containing protein [Actinoplanes solisilvae]